MTTASDITSAPWTDPFRSVRSEHSGKAHTQDAGAARPQHTGSDAAIRCDVTETEFTYEIEADLPGFESEEVSVAIESGMLSIAAFREEPRRPGRQRIRERCARDVERRFLLPGVIGSETVDAHLRNGVLRIIIAKSQEQQPHPIRIR